MKVSEWTSKGGIKYRRAWQLLKKRKSLFLTGEVVAGVAFYRSGNYWFVKGKKAKFYIL